MAVIAIDTETHLFEPGTMAPKVVCLTYATEEKSGILVGDDILVYIKAALKKALDGKAIIAGHSISYDFACLLSDNLNDDELEGLVWEAYTQMRIECTKVRERLLDIGRGTRKGKYSLAALAKEHFDIEMDKTTHRLGYGELDGKPLREWPPGAVQYAQLDATTTLRLYKHQTAKSEEYKVPLENAAAQSSADMALRLLSNWGIHTDGEHVEELVEKVGSRMHELREQLMEDGIIRTVGKKQSKNLKFIRTLVEMHYPGDELPETPKGSVKTGREVYEKCNDERLLRLAEFTKLEKINSTYLGAMLKGIEHPIHAFFNVLGAATGRTSCSGPNLQNQPRLPGLRECFVPREGHVFIACDFDSQELRTLAQACMETLGKSKLAERYQEDKHFDPHLEFAASMAQIDVKAFKTCYYNGNKKHKEMRQHAKCANFGFPGGMGPAKFVKYAEGFGLNIDEDRARELKTMWLEQWPEMKLYFEWVSVNTAEEGSTILQLRSNRLRGDCGYCDGANTLFQGLAADASKAALFETSKRCYLDRSSDLYNCRPVIFVHDEIILESPEETAHEAAMELQEVMEACMQNFTPDVPTSATPTIMSRWSKAAEQVWEDGRLVPWSGHTETPA